MTLCNCDALSLRELLQANRLWRGATAGRPGGRPCEPHASRGYHALATLVKLSSRFRRGYSPQLVACDKLRVGILCSNEMRWRPQEGQRSHRDDAHLPARRARRHESLHEQAKWARE